ncbi:MAG: hypothetical protein R3E00_17120 [Paracoccaceae bacterium]
MTLGRGPNRVSPCGRGFHVPENLRVMPLGINRNIKKGWFASDWLEPPRAGPFGFELPGDGDDDIPW